MALHRMTKLFRPGDPVLVVLLLVLGLWGWFGHREPGSASDRGVVRVTSADGSLKLLPPDTSCVLEVKGPLGITTVEVEAGTARILNSPCPHKLCIEMGTTRKPGRPIVCLPNGVILEITGGESEVDGTTR